MPGVGALLVNHLPRQRKVILFLSKFSCFFLKKEASGPLRSCVIMVQLGHCKFELRLKTDDFGQTEV